MVLGAAAVVAGVLLFTARNTPHIDMAVPTDSSAVDIMPAAIVSARSRTK
jgi:hypothetical protein